MSDSYSLLFPIMKCCGTPLDAESFYWAVNSAYHTAEAPVYRSVHADMFQSLKPKWQRLVMPLKHQPNQSIRWLDVGCGTGLVAELLSGLLDDKIRSGLLLDPSPSMIDEARKNSSKWISRIKTEFLVGTLSSLKLSESFDLITVNSVLHHIPDLPSFISSLALLLCNGGTLLTCHDPVTESSQNEVKRWRQRVYDVANIARSAKLEASKKFRSWRGLSSIKSPIADATNQSLLDSGAIRNPLTIYEIWAITDFHVPGQVANIGRGVSIDIIRDSVGAVLRLEDYLTYGYWGVTSPIRPFSYLEKQLFEANDKSGTLFGSRWIKTCNGLQRNG